MLPGLGESTALPPLIKLPGASLASTNPFDFGGVVRNFLPFQVNRWDHPERDQPFSNQSGILRLGDLTLLATLGSAIHGDVEQKSEAQLVLPYVAGINAFTIEERTYAFRSSCLFIPAARSRIQVHCSICSGVIISFPPETLVPVAHAIGGPGFDALSLRSALERPTILSRRADPRRDRLHNLLMETLAYTEQCLTLGASINPMLRLDDLIRRLIVMLLVPDLLEASQGAPVSSEPFPHQNLLEWLLGHLHEPISLSDMEQRSSYSRRSLQYAFKQRFGCGPMQWLRKQRLAKAKALLEHPGSSPRLREIAHACGYLSQSSFSRDFLAHYGESPSRLMRRSKETSQLERLGYGGTT
jgi:AraC-like DNA-binding protein